MIADVTITEKSFGPKSLYKNLRFSIGDGEKIGVVGRNGVGKSTLLGILAGTDTDFTGDVIFRRGIHTVSSRQEHHDHESIPVVEYILGDLPEYAKLHHILETYPAVMGDDPKKISVYTDALERFSHLGYYHNQELIEEDLKNMQIPTQSISGTIGELSGGQKRLVEVVKIMHSKAHLALIDEPTNHMDYVAKQKFIDWMKSAQEAMLIITHDRDVLAAVDRIIEIKDGKAEIYNGNYDQYLKQNAMSTTGAMNEFEVVQRQIANLRDKVIQFRRLKERSRDPDTIKQFKRRETQAKEELAKLEAIPRPSFWIDKESASSLGLKSGAQYEKFKAKNIRIHGASAIDGHAKLLVDVQQISLSYGSDALFSPVTFQLREGERIELRGRNGAGKTTLIRAMLDYIATDTIAHDIQVLGGIIEADRGISIGVYEQEVGPELFDKTLHDAIEHIYLSRKLAISETKIRQLLSDYLFEASDSLVPVRQLSGGQKSRLQLIAMMANNPRLLVLDEPTNHLDLPSIEELENAIKNYRGAVLYVSHDTYFQNAVGGEVIAIKK